MPELPDVEVLRQRVAQVALGRRIQAVEIKSPRILAGITSRDLDKRLVGHRFCAAQRYGKRLYCGLDSGGWLSMHFGLTGDLEFFCDSEARPPFARLVVDFAKGEHVAYTNRRMIGRIEWVQDMGADVRAKNLGPDILDPKFTLTAFKRVLAQKRGRVKTVLMDQSVMAGIGNAYSDEIMFQARLHPLCRLEALDERVRGELYRTLQQVVRRAIKCGAEMERLPPMFLIPYRRAGGRCPRGDGDVSRIEIDGRGSYFCAGCQRQPGPDGKAERRTFRRARRRPRRSVDGGVRHEDV